MRKMRIVLAMAGVSLVMTPSGAAVNSIVAGPGAGASGYATPLVVARRGLPVKFVNADLTSHNVVAKGVFWTPTVRAGKTATLQGLANAKTGVLYRFMCTIHGSAMSGFLMVR